MSKTDKWLQVVATDKVPQLHTLPRCMTLCKLTPDNYMLLAAVDMRHDIVSNTSLKVFRGTKLVYERSLSGMPCALESLYIDNTEYRTPVIATAIGSDVLFFRHLKPYFKYTLPELGAGEVEQEIWRSLPLSKAEKYSILIEKLRTLNVSRLTPKSQRLLQIRDGIQIAEFIRKYADAVVERRRNIVAMCKLKCVSSNEHALPSHLVLAIDNGELIVLETQSFSVIYKARVCSYETTPSMLSVHGTYETHFYMVIASRCGSIYLLRKSAHEGQEICKLPEPASDMLLLTVDQTIMVTCNSKRLICYSKKGKQLFCNSLPEHPICMISISLMHLGMTLTCIALQGGKVQFYMQRHLVDEFTVCDSVKSMCFGCMGLEEHVLTLITTQGDIIIKILKRQANFNPFDKKVAVIHDAQLKEITVLDKTKKNSIFIEQADQEKQSFKSTYSYFQRGLWQLRHLAASKMLHAMKSNEISISTSFKHASIKLTAKVCGFAPEFRFYLLVHNVSIEKINAMMMLVIHSDRYMYITPKSLLKLPIIMPQNSLRIDFVVTVLADPIPETMLIVKKSQIRLMLIARGSTKPLIAAKVIMPQTESKV